MNSMLVTLRKVVVRLRIMQQCSITLENLIEGRSYSTTQWASSGGVTMGFLDMPVIYITSLRVYEGDCDI
jgi:hypothetical protein